MKHPVSGLPLFIPYEGPTVPYVGMCFDDPEEGDRIEIKGFDFEFGTEDFDDETGRPMERFGWIHL